MSRIIIVQVVETWWTKRSRGGSLAVARRAVPDVAEIPYPQRQILEGSAHYHHLTYQERDDFLLPQDTVSVRPVPLRLVGVTIDAVADHVQVQYKWDCGCGAPERGWVRKEFSLALNEWGQVTHNGRFSDFDGGQWSYHRWSVNVGVVETFSPALFTTHSPTVRFSAEALLR